MKSFNLEETESKNLSRDVRLKGPVSSAFWSEMYAQALSEKSVGKYKKSLSADEIGEIERLLESMGEAFKYWLPTVLSFPSCQFRGKKKQPTPCP